MLHMIAWQQTCFAISGAAMIDCQALSVNSFCVMRLPSPCCADTLNPLECLGRATQTHSNMHTRCLPRHWHDASNMSGNFQIGESCRHAA